MTTPFNCCATFAARSDARWTSAPSCCRAAPQTRGAGRRGRERSGGGDRGGRSDKRPPRRCSARRTRENSAMRRSAASIEVDAACARPAGSPDRRRRSLRCRSRRAGRALSRAARDAIHRRRIGPAEFASIPTTSMSTSSIAGSRADEETAGRAYWNAIWSTDDDPGGRDGDGARSSTPSTAIVPRGSPRRSRRVNLSTPDPAQRSGLSVPSDRVRAGRPSRDCCPTGSSRSRCRARARSTGDRQPDPDRADRGPAVRRWDPARRDAPRESSHQPAANGCTTTLARSRRVWRSRCRWPCPARAVDQLVVFGVRSQPRCRPHRKPHSRIC